ncbi:vanadium-dependent haloperoxidase [Luteolibacter yonseiensis]|uniref:Vanadium-dependent haloperoxidase n=1 Tax=Luteolibacter yonseiensis TaxID=1144680 RepID=A0A934R021_9BACT|nr:vanadium-dependent haloperoxidase [Luteolibacter yonseiensis]MBK1814007.1 vanadium-dependent haloperoxidase [Luteolibacter yonseiensis]
MKLPPVRTLVFSLAAVLLAPRATAENAVLAWNRVVLLALKEDATPPLLVARSLAILHLGIDRAVKEKGSEAAVTGAGYTAAVLLLPGHHAVFENLRDEEMKQLAGDTVMPDFQAGEKAAREIITSRENDGSSEHVSYVPKFTPGMWRRTPPFLRPPELAQWAKEVQPFVLKTPDQFRCPPPPALASADYATAYDEVRSIGGKNSAVRTSEQSTIAKFWSDFSYTETPSGHWNSIARTLVEERKLPLRECSRIFAVLNVTMVDTGIACWDSKYHYNAWRPATAVQGAADDGNDATAPESGWMPMLNTPAHPEYPSGHSAFSGAAATVLAEMLGGDQVRFTVRADAMPGAERRFESLSACAKECGESRVFCGIHFRYACDAGLELGKKVGNAVLASMK